MEIKKLIEALERKGDYAVLHDGEGDNLTADDGRLMLKAAEVIKLLWEVVVDVNKEKYRMKFDEMMEKKNG